MGFEPARQRYIAIQKPNTLHTELSDRAPHVRANHVIQEEKF